MPDLARANALIESTSIFPESPLEIHRLKLINHPLHINSILGIPRKSLFPIIKCRWARAYILIFNYRYLNYPLYRILY
ncbi:MAG: hypothetical protein ACI8XG_001315 [Congregibacter sp.]|jgi:hypothetical protein